MLLEESSTIPQLGALMVALPVMPISFPDAPRGIDAILAWTQSGDGSCADSHCAEVEYPHEKRWLALGHDGFHIPGFSCERAIERRAVDGDNCAIASVHHSVLRRGVLSGRGAISIVEFRGPGNGCAVGGNLHGAFCLEQDADVGRETDKAKQDHQTQQREHYRLATLIA